MNEESSNFRNESSNLKPEIRPETPPNPAKLYTFAILKSKTGDFETAAKFFMDSFALRPSAGAAMGAADSLAKLGRLFEACEWYQNLLDLPSLFQSRLEFYWSGNLKFGTSLMALGKIPEAEEKFRFLIDAPKIPNGIKADAQKCLQIIQNGKTNFHDVANFESNQGTNFPAHSCPEFPFPRI